MKTLARICNSPLAHDNDGVSVISDAVHAQIKYTSSECGLWDDGTTRVAFAMKHFSFSFSNFGWFATLPPSNGRALVNERTHTHAFLARRCCHFGWDAVSGCVWSTWSVANANALETTITTLNRRRRCTANTARCTALYDVDWLAGRRTGAPLASRSSNHRMPECTAITLLMPFGSFSFAIFCVCLRFFLRFFSFHF